MKDTVIKETGNSRFLRSNVAEDITFAEFIALLRAGQLPIDLAGINEEGIDTLGMPLGKGTLLDDETETVIWGSPGNRKPTEALKTIFETLSAGVSEKAKIVTGTYTGNGAASRTISLGFTPKAVLVTPKTAGDIVAGNDEGDFTTVAFAIAGVNSVHKDSQSYNVLAITNDGFTVSYVRNNDLSPKVYVESNSNGRVYNYIAIA